MLAKWREPLSWDLAHLCRRRAAAAAAAAAAVAAAVVVVVVVVAVGAAVAGVEAVARHDPLRAE
jgi:hypothetical protein